MNASRAFIIISFLLFLLYPKSIFSQSWDYSYDSYTRSDEFPSNTIYCITPDLNGKLWIGTDNGLFCFDGSSLIKFSRTNGLPNNDIFKLYCDSKNRIWILSMGENIAYILHGVVHNKYNDPQLAEVRIKNKVVDIFEDREENIWVISFPFLANIISNKNVIRSNLHYSQFYTYGSIKMNEGIYFITNKNTCFYDYKDHSFHYLKKSKQTKINGLQIVNGKSYALNSEQELIQAKIEDIKNSKFYSALHYWTLFYSIGKLWKLSSDGLHSLKINDFSKSEVFLKDYPVSGIGVDKYQNLWVGTLNNGLFKLNSSIIRNLKPYPKVALNSINSILINSKKVILGNNNGWITFLNRVNKNEFKSLHINTKSILSYRVLKLLEVDNQLIICTDIGVFYYDISNNTFTKITNEGAFKNIYYFNNQFILLTHIGIKYFNSNFKLTREYVLNDRFYSFCEYGGEKLFGSENALYVEHNGLTKYKLDQPFTHRIMDLKTFDSLLCVATTEKGVFFVKDHKVIRNLSLEQGLNSNACSKIVPYKNVLFIATNNGICRYNYSSRSTYKIMESDGLPSNNVQDITINQDTLYAATDNGLSVIPIASLPDKYPFSFFISPSTSTKDTCWELNGSIRSRTDFPVTLTMNSISLGTKGPVKYYYRILERDSSFTTTLDPTITLKLDDPGTYTFESYSSDINNALSQKALMQIYIVPYWYQTFLFKLSCLLLFISSIFLFTRFMIARSLKKEKLKRALADKIQQLELEAWKSNINPHFLFNSINTMQSLFSSNQFEKANEYIASFSRVLRKTIDNSEKLMISIEEEIGYLKNYLSLEKIKKGNHLIYVVDFDREVLPYYIPTLLIQPVIENSIKHGIQEKKHGVITVTFRRKDNRIICTILDNGKGLPQNFAPETESKGLKMIIDKIKITERITGQSIHFEIKNRRKHNKPGYGINCTLVLPVFESLYYYPTPDNVIMDKL